jgi:hypothetical protein
VVWAIWCSLPVGLLVVAQQRASNTPLVRPVPAWASVRPATSREQREISVALAWSRPDAIFAPALTGVIEQVRMEPGSVISDLDRPLVVGGIERLAYRSSAPFERPLRSGDRGRDVSALNTMLAKLGLPSSPGEAFTASTARGVEALRRQLGAPAWPEPVFDPSWVLFLPAEPFEVAEVGVLVGQPAPPPGTQLATSRPRLRDAVLQTKAAAAPESTFSPTAPSPPTQGMPIDTGEQLEVAGVILAVTPERDRVDPSSLPTLQTLVDPASSTVDALAVRPPEPGSMMVPAAATFSVADGRVCVRRRREIDIRSVAVTIRREQFGTVNVTGDLREGDEVQLGVPAVDRSC